MCFFIFLILNKKTLKKNKLSQIKKKKKKKQIPDY